MSLRVGLMMVLALTACTGAGTTATVDDLLEADRAFAQATAERGVEGWVSYFAADGIQFRQAEPVIGHDAIRAFMEPAFQDPNFSLTWEPVSGELSASGDLGYTRGRFESRGSLPDGTVASGAGSYVTIWRRMEDGTWKVAVDIGNPDPPPAPDGG
ncbi:MAG: DUF4440 domain-containing protein [Gemmatimonadota bacterium]|nr:DUF4440 domain-containing protein [Gemmatimonadota bacterium]